MVEALQTPPVLKHLSPVLVLEVGNKEPMTIASSPFRGPTFSRMTSGLQAGHMTIRRRR